MPTFIESLAARPVRIHWFSERAFYSVSPRAASPKLPIFVDSSLEKLLGEQRFRGFTMRSNLRGEATAVFEATPTSDYVFATFGFSAEKIDNVLHDDENFPRVSCLGRFGGKEIEGFAGRGITATDDSDKTIAPRKGGDYVCSVIHGYLKWEGRKSRRARPEPNFYHA